MMILMMSMLTACSTLGSKLADAGEQKRQLADGQTVYGRVNQVPTADWHCKQLGMPQFYNWAEMKMEGQFCLSLNGGASVLMDKAVDYANKNNLKPNYVDLQLPKEASLGGGPGGGISTSWNLAPGANAVVIFYQCKLINPDKQGPTN